MDPTRLAKEIHSSTAEVFTTMLGVEVAAGEAVGEQSGPGLTNGVVSLIGLAGSWVGTGSISCSAEAACQFSSRFLMTKLESVDEEVLDAIAELTNMIIGGFKTRLEEELGPMGLSIPTVIFGHNFRTRTVSRNNWTLVPFTCGDQSFDIHICLAPNERRPIRQARPSHTELQSTSS